MGAGRICSRTHKIGEEIELGAGAARDGDWAIHRIAGLAGTFHSVMVSRVRMLTWSHSAKLGFRGAGRLRPCMVTTESLVMMPEPFPCQTPHQAKMGGGKSWREGPTFFGVSKPSDERCPGLPPGFPASWESGAWTPKKSRLRMGEGPNDTPGD